MTKCIICAIPYLNERYAYDIIQKVYGLYEKKIEIPNFDKRKKLLEDYDWWLGSR